MTSNDDSPKTTDGAQIEPGIKILLSRLADAGGTLEPYQINAETDIEPILSAEREGLVERRFRHFATKTKCLGVDLTDAGRRALETENA